MVYQNISASEDIVWVDATHQIRDIVNQLNKVGSIGIDIESNSMYKYHKRASLIQISAEKTVYLLDIQKLGLPGDIFSLFTNPNIIKVFQDMEYDLSLLWTQFKCKPKGVFDISVADKLIHQSMSKRSLDKMIKEYLNLSVNYRKSIQKSNWSMRPLSDEQIKYAANDVKFNPLIMNEQKQILKQDYRLSCFLKFMDGFIPKIIERKFNIHFMWKLKDVETLDQSGLNRLKRLLTLREEYAKSNDIPPHWICRDSHLVKIARKKSMSKSQFHKFYTEGRKLKHYQIKGLDLCYKEMMKSSADELIEKPPHGTSLRRYVPIENDQNQVKPIPGRVKLLRAWQIEVAKRTNLLPEFILNRSELPVYATYQNKELETQITLPGVVPEFQSHFINDLLSYATKNISLLNKQQLLNVSLNRIQ
ncbi:MAG: HRDC domain-containing protein [Candidatus Kariarchaeaceae archaeon]|jgi:ribonuclease D